MGLTAIQPQKEREPIYARLLGGLTLENENGEFVEVTSKRSKSVLGRLLLEPGSRISRSELATELWPDAFASDARRNLRQVVFGIHKQLEAIAPQMLLQDDEFLWIEKSSIRTDVERFFQLIESDASLDQLREAHNLHRGPLLGDIQETWIMVRRSELDDAFIQVLLKLANAAYRNGQYDEGLAFAQQIIDIDPLSERGHFALVRILAARDQLGAARQAYNIFAQQLGLRTGATPSVSVDKLLRRRTNVTDILDTASIAEAAERKRAPVFRRWHFAVLIALSGIALSAAFRPKPEPSLSALMFEWQSLADLERSDNASRQRQAELAIAIGRYVKEDNYGSKEHDWSLRIEPMRKTLIDVELWAVRHNRLAALEIGALFQRQMFLLGEVGLDWIALLDQVVDPKKPIATSIEADAFIAWINGYGLNASEPNLDQRTNEAIAVYKSSGNIIGEFHAIRILGLNYGFREDYVRAKKEYLRAKKIASTLGKSELLALVQLQLGFCHEQKLTSQVEDTRSTIVELFLAFDLFLQAENNWGVMFSLTHMSSFGADLPNSPESNEQWRGCLDRIKLATQFFEQRGIGKHKIECQRMFVQYTVRLGDQAEIAALARDPSWGQHMSQYSLNDRYIIESVLARTIPEFRDGAVEGRMQGYATRLDPQTLRRWKQEAENTTQAEVFALLIGEKGS